MDESSTGMASDMDLEAAGRKLRAKEGELEKHGKTITDLEAQLESANSEVAFLKDRMEQLEQEDGKSKAAHVEAQRQLESSHDNTVGESMEWLGLVQ